MISIRGKIKTSLAKRAKVCYNQKDKGACEMAKLYTKDNRIQRQWKWCRVISAWGARIGYAALGAMLAVLVFSFVYKDLKLLYILIPGALFFAVCLLAAELAGKQAGVFAAGVEGENATKRLVRHLPSAYTAISNVRITFDGNTSELDMVVVGPTGVFVVETKNYTGQIVGNTEEENWKRTKRTEGGRAYVSTMYNPIKQVSTHTWRLSKFLKQNKLFVWVQGAVYFSDPSVSLKLTGNLKKIPVFHAEAKDNYKTNKLLRFIRSFKMQKRLSPKTIDRIVKLLKG